MKLALRTVAAALVWIVPLAGPAMLASACKAAPASTAQTHAISKRARTRSTPAAPGRALHRAAAASGPASVAPASGNRVASGLVIGIDPETGQLGMATPEQLAKLSEAMRSSATAFTAPAAPIRHADGRVSMFVGNWMREYSVVRLTPAGRPVLGCVDGHDAATRLLRQVPAQAETEER